MIDLKKLSLNSFKEKKKTLITEPSTLYKLTDKYFCLYS